MSNRDSGRAKDDSGTPHECWSCGELYDIWDAAANCCGMGVAIRD